MSLAFRLKTAKQKGEHLIRDFGIDSLPIDPFAIAASRDIIVEAKPDTEPGVSGMLLRHGDMFGILYATHIQSEGFQRFSVAHELGHYFLEGHMDHLLPKGGVHASHAGFVSSDEYEREADNFAAGMLMPSHLFKLALGRSEPGLAEIEAIANLCRTSLTASAIRYTELTDEAVVVVVSTGLTIDYCFLSETIKSLRPFRSPRKGTQVPRRSITARFNANADRIAHAERMEAEIDITEWLDGARAAPAMEQVIGLGSYGRTLTVLTCPSLLDERYRDDDDQDEDLIESWTPRFRY